MISGIINKVAAGTREYQHVLQEVAEFSALKKEINKARAIVELNAKGEITFVNENLCRALGYRENDLVKQHHKALLSRAESTKPEYEQFWAELNTGKSQVGAFKLLSQQGKEVWFQGYYAPVWDEAAKRLRKVVAYLTDITKDAQRTQSLQASEDALNQSFGVMECDMQGNILHCNNLFAKPLQYTEEELIGKSVAVFLTEAVAKSPDYQEMWRRLRAGEVLSHEIQRFSKSHQPLWFQSTYIPVNDQDNKPYKVLVYSFCITASKQKIADFEGQVAAINNVQGVISFDPAGHVLAANKHFCNYCGYTEKELVGQHHSGLVPESFKQTAEYKSWWSRLAAGEAIVGTFEHVRKDGKPFWLQGVYSPIADVNGEVFKIVKYVIDVTEKVQTEQANSQRAREAVMIKNALESSSNNLMVADSDGIITYMNPATLDLMRASSATFKQLFPHFDAEKLIGQNFDVFHKSPAHQRNLLGMLKGKHVTEIPVGDMHFRLTANPIFDAQGERLGSVVEWIDLTQEKRVENQIRQVLDAAVAGDVSSRLDTAGVQGPAVKTMEAINQLLDIFNGVLINVREASETINTAANEIASGNNDLSSRTEQQASNLEETASSMEELASTVKQNADNARQANQMAEAASQVAIRGGEVVGNVVTTMSAINDSAHKIEDIISVIDGIAFQTNILALNAAVEAARAGEQGRGFAVVAGEVRNLAQRSASAAKEIKELITDSVNKTAEGTKLVENAGTTMHEVVTSVQRVTDIMSEITAASAEQSSGINQVNDAVNHMDEVTQQNAALVEEAAAAAESLVEQASNLMDTVNKFTLTAGDTRGSRVSQVTPSVKSRPTPKPAAVNKPQPAAHYQPAKSQKTGTDNQDWEEF